MNFCNVMLTFSTFSNKKDFGVLFFLVALYVTAFRKIRMVHHARADLFFAFSWAYTPNRIQK